MELMRAHRLRASVGAVATYVPGDHESALSRDVVLAPPTCCCCCCCCCCTLAAPEIVGGARFARETAEAYEKAGSFASFWDVQLAFAAGALLASLLFAPIAGPLGAWLFLATGGIYAFVIIFALAGGILFHTTRLGREHGDGETSGAFAGFAWGLAVLFLIGLAIAGEIALVLALGQVEGALVALVAAGALVPVIRAGWVRRREARELALAAEEERRLGAAPPP